MRYISRLNCNNFTARHTFTDQGCGANNLLATVEVVSTRHGSENVFHVNGIRYMYHVFWCDACVLSFNSHRLIQHGISNVISISIPAIHSKDVKFRNLNLELVPEISMCMNSSKTS